VALEFDEEGYIDVLGLGAIALVSALLGLYVARGTRAARAMGWILAVLSAATLVLMCTGSFLASQAPERDEILGPLPLLFFGYVAIVCISYIAAGASLLPASVRSYFRRR